MFLATMLQACLPSCLGFDPVLLLGKINSCESLKSYCLCKYDVQCQHLDRLLVSVIMSRGFSRGRRIAVIET